MRRFTPDEKNVKTYANVKNLDKALEKFHFADFYHHIYRFESGRVTAIFTDVAANCVIFEGFPWCR